ncbi:uncharacterized protein LOC123865016 [Maniola jurtina]|uniref:uncharacterized protein LOC123865016 n=1 Tax=Maniola jurtina TaxID=191418 RepID=UPI001E68749C|nr:uncharacterized protein LOC123865016 [Maniola jurtina]XP_045761787.1 uncharacterized protein LOC123865016 [Maniola jurtina]XP_045761788.1 uncharacterized protein LOC123865016 [Maniola jurtina]
MAGCYLICALFVCLNIFALEGKHVTGLYCQDPDTRKLYPINSTWPSESFCGNYTCKLRRKNVTQTDHEPVTKVNITALENKTKENNTSTSDMDKSPSEQAFIVIKKVQTAKQPAFHKEAINRINAIKDEYKNGSTDTDRYLTESEIKSITEILHTVKKSDLEAIVEIYNIAQDIYKELDNSEEEKLVKNHINNIKTDESIVKKNLKTNAKESVSYWYEPLHYFSPIVKPNDLKVEGTNPVPNAKSYAHPASYFKGPLTEKDFRTLPYYYPLSNFQRISSYVHNNAPQNLQNIHHRKPCNQKFNNVEPTWHNTHTNKVKRDPANPKTIQSMLLPYPFSYIHHYNISTYPASFYYNNYPWAQLNPYTSIQNYPQHYYGAYIAQVPNTAVIANVNEVEKKRNQEEDVNYINSEENISNMNKAEEVFSEHLPEWQTEELSAKVLDEVKANILDDSKLLKPLNIAKNIKLEKVGKVIKLDELIRTKRETKNIHNEDEESEIIQYEPYIEKTTCESSTELGFFRMGNLTEPYPACCPQKIS